MRASYARRRYAHYCLRGLLIVYFVTFAAEHRLNNNLASACLRPFSTSCINFILMEQSQLKLDRARCIKNRNVHENIMPPSSVTNFDLTIDLFFRWNVGLLSIMFRSFAQMRRSKLILFTNAQHIVPKPMYRVIQL